MRQHNTFRVRHTIKKKKSIRKTRAGIVYAAITTIITIHYALHYHYLLYYFTRTAILLQQLLYYSVPTLLQVVITLIAIIMRVCGNRTSAFQGRRRRDAAAVRFFCQKHRIVRRRYFIVHRAHADHTSVRTVLLYAAHDNHIAVYNDFAYVALVRDTPRQ